MKGAQMRVDVGASPRVVVEALGDLIIRGWDELQVVATADDDDEGSVVEEGDEAVRVRFDTDGELRLPHGSDLTIQLARGDLRLAGVDGPVAVGEVSGDLKLKDVGHVRVELVSGDLDVQGATGDVAVARVAADATVRDVAGGFWADAVGADLFVHGVAGSVSAVVGADATVSLEPAADATYRIVAGGSIACRLPAGANARLQVVSGSGKLRVELPDAAPPDMVDGVAHVAVGDDGPLVSLQAGGSVLLAVARDDSIGLEDQGARFAEEFGDLADELAKQVEAKAEGIVRTVSVRLGKLAETLPEVLEAAGLSAADADHLAEKVRTSGEKAARHAAQQAEKRAAAAASRARHKAARAARKVERAERRVRRRMMRKGRQRGRGRWAPAGASGTPEPVSAEERLSVLRMLEQGKVNAEQAESLLRALEGRPVPEA